MNYDDALFMWIICLHRVTCYLLFFIKMKFGKLRKGNNSNAKEVITKIGYLFQKK